MALYNIAFKCLLCEATYTTNKRHFCQRECKWDAHIDFCTNCCAILMGNFIKQWQRKLRVEKRRE